MLANWSKQFEVLVKGNGRGREDQADSPLPILPCGCSGLQSPPLFQCIFLLLFHPLKVPSSAPHSMTTNNLSQIPDSARKGSSPTHHPSIIFKV